MITVYCMIFVMGMKGQQKLPFDFSPAEASKFLSGYGRVNGISVPELQHLACQDIDYTLGFLEDQE